MVKLMGGGKGRRGIVMGIKIAMAVISAVVVRNLIFAFIVALLKLSAWGLLYLRCFVLAQN